MAMPPHLASETAHSPAQLSRIIAEMYPKATTPRLLRWMQVRRPFICPFDLLLPRIAAPATLLDVGCGGGLWLGLCAHFGLLARGVGFDYNAPAIATADAMRAQLGERGQMLTFQHARAQDGAHAWPSEQFSVVSIIDVMHHVPPADQPALIAQAAAHVEPGGLLLYKDIASTPWAMASMNRLHDLVLAQQWVHYAAADDVTRWAESAGLVRTDQVRMHRLWYPHQLLVFSKPE